MATDNEDRSLPMVRPGAVAGGLILLALGVAMLLDTTGAVNIHLRHSIGPIVLIVLGTLMMLGEGGVVWGRRVRDANGEVRMKVRQRGGATGGVWLIGVGAWLLASQTHVFGLTFANSWPLFIILSGLIVVIRGIR